MTRSRDRVIAAIAVVLLAALATAVVVLVLDAQRSGIDTRRDFRLEQARSEAARMDARVQQAYDAFLGSYGAPGAFALTPGDPTDAMAIAPQSPDARTGTVLVDRDGTIVNGSLLRDENVIGTTLERDGLVRRTVYPEVPVRVEYALTDAGRSLCAPLSALQAWAVEHLDDVSAAQRAHDEVA